MIQRSISGLSLQTRITAAAMVTAVGVLMVACLLFTFEQWGAERGALMQTQKETAAVLAPRLALATKDGDRAEAAQIIKNAAMSPQLLGAEVTDDQGRVLAAYRQGGEPAFSQVNLLSSTTPISAGGGIVGALKLQSHLEPAGQFLPRYFALSAALFFAATALSLFLGRVLAKRVIEPVERLSRVMGEVAISGDLGRRVDEIEDDECGRLIESFNALLDRLQANDDEKHITMQALVAARDEAEAANVQKSQFLANMSHEIRTPLNGVLAMAQVMAMGELAPQQTERLSVIQGSGEALLTILNDILDVSKIEAGKLELEIMEFELDGLACAAAAGFAAVAESKGIALELEIKPAASGARLGDPARFRQILSNLISNAVKFTAQGSVRVVIEGVGADGDAGVRLMVADSGIGIPQDKLPLLFQKFTQLDASTTRRFGGTGLGLSICQELTSKMNGVIWAESVEGQGTQFFVELPLVKVIMAQAPAIAQAETPDDQGRPLRILAAEDNATNQVVLSTIIEIFGAELQIVDNGRLAVEAWAAGAFDVILMDIQMPVMDGITAARQIREAETAAQRRRTPIIALSANAMTHQVQEYMAAGMDGHVSKPIALNKLHAALEEALTLQADLEVDEEVAA